MRIGVIHMQNFKPKINRILHDVSKKQEAQKNLENSLKKQKKEKFIYDYEYGILKEK